MVGKIGSEVKLGPGRFGGVQVVTYSELPAIEKSAGKKVRGVLNLPIPSQITHTPANLSNTTNLCALLSEPSNQKAYDPGPRWKGQGHGQVNTTFSGGCWTEAVSQTLSHLKKEIGRAAGEYITENTILNCSMHVGIRSMYDHEDVRAFLTMRERFEDSEDAINEEILNEYQVRTIVRALGDFNPPCLTGGKNRNLLTQEFVHEELAKLGKLGLTVWKVAYFAILQGFDLQPMKGTHAALRRRIHGTLEQFYGEVRARVDFIYGGLARYGVNDTFIRPVDDEEEEP